MVKKTKVQLIEEYQKIYVKFRALTNQKNKLFLKDLAKKKVVEIQKEIDSLGTSYDICKKLMEEIDSTK